MARRRNMVPDDYLTLTPGELKRVVEMQDTLSAITNAANPQGVLASLQMVEDGCRRIVRDAFWRAF